MKNLIAERIRFNRLVKSLSQENMANELNISVAAYSNIERGVTDITITRLNQICQIFGLSMMDIIDPKQINYGSDKDSPVYRTADQENNFLIRDEIAQLKMLIEKLQKDMNAIQKETSSKPKLKAKYPNKLK